MNNHSMKRCIEHYGRYCKCFAGSHLGSTSVVEKNFNVRDNINYLGYNFNYWAMAAMVLVVLKSYSGKYYYCLKGSISFVVCKENDPYNYYVKG